MFKAAMIRARVDSELKEEAANRSSTSSGCRPVMRSASSINKLSCKKGLPFKVEVTNRETLSSD